MWSDSEERVPSAIGFSPNASLTSSTSHDLRLSSSFSSPDKMSIKLKVLASEKEALTKEKDEMVVGLSSIKIKLNQAEDLLRSMSHEFGIERSKMAGELQKANLKVALLEKEKTELEALLAGMKGTARKDEEYETTIAKLAEEITQYRGKYEASVHDFQSLQMELSQMEKTYEESKQRYEESITKLEAELNASSARYETKTTEMVTELRTAREKYDKTMSDAARQRKAKDKASEELKNVQDQFSSLKGMYEEYKNQTRTEISQLKKKLDTSKGETSAIRETKQVLQKELTSLKEEYNKLKESHNKLQKTSKKEIDKLADALNKKGNEVKKIAGSTASEISQLKSQFSSKETELDRLNDEMNVTKSQLDSTKKERESLKKMLKSKEEKMFKLEHMISCLEESVTELETYKDQTSQLSADLQQTRTLCETYREEIQGLKKSEKTYKLKYEDTKGKIKAAKKDMVQLHEQLALLEEDKNKLVAQHESLADDKEKLCETNLELRDELNRAKEAIESLSTDNQDLQQTVESRLTELENIRGDFDSLQNRHEELKGKTDKTFKKLQRDLGDWKKKFDNASSDCKQIEKARVKLQSEYQHLKKEFDAVVIEKEKTMEEKKRISTELSSVKEKNQQIKQSFDLAKEKLDTEIADLKETLETCDTERKTVLDAKSELEKELEDTSRTCEDTMNNYNNYKKSAEAETDELVANLKKRTAEVKRLVDVISESNHEIEELRRELDVREGDIDSLSGRLECTTKELDDALVERKKLLKDVMQLTTDLSAARSQCEELGRTVAGLERYQARAGELEQEVGTLGERCREYDAEVERRKSVEDELRATIADLRRELAELQKKYEACCRDRDHYMNLERETRTRLDEAAAGKATAEEQVLRLNKEVDELKIQYEECEQEMEKFMNLEKETREKLEEATGQMERAATQVGVLHTEVKDVNQKYDKCVTEKEQLVKVEKETKIELQRVTAEKDILQLKEQEVSEKLQEMIEECEQARSAEQEAQRRLRDLMSEKENLQGSMKGLEMQFKKLDGDYKGLVSKCEQIQDEKQHIQKEKQSIIHEKDSLQSRLQTVEGDIDDLRYRFKCVQTDYEDLKDSKELLESEKQMFIMKIELIIKSVQEWGLEVEGLDLSSQFNENKEIALDILSKRVGEMKIKYDACEIQLEKVISEMTTQISNLQQDLKSSQTSKETLQEELEKTAYENKDLKKKLERKEVIGGSRPETPIGPDGQKMTFDAVKQRNKVLEYSYKALLEKYDKMKKAFENGEPFDEVDSFFDDDLELTVISTRDEDDAHEFKMVQLQKKELEKKIQLKEIEFRQQSDEMEHEVSDLRTLLDSAAKVKEKMDADMVRQKGEFEIALAKARSEALLKYIESEHEREEIVERMTEASENIADLEEQLKLAEEERDLQTLKVAHMKKECDLYEKHIHDLEKQCDSQQTQVREAMSEHKETIAMLGHLQMQQDLLRREQHLELSDIKGEFKRLGSQVSKSSRIPIMAAPASAQLALPAPGSHRSFNADDKIDNLDEGHKALEIKHFKMVEDMSRMERELGESREKHRKEMEMLQEQLRLEREKNGSNIDGSATRMINYSGKAKHVKGYITESGEYGYATEMLSVKERLIALEQNNQSIQGENKMLKDKLKQQEELLIKVQHDVSLDGSSISQPKLDVTQELVQILQEQRDELLSKVSEQREMNKQFAEVREEKTYLDATLKRERRMWKQKVREKEKVELELLAERLGRQKNIKAYNQLEDMISKMEDIERKLSSEKGYELYDEDSEVASINSATSTKADRLEKARDVMVAKLARQVGYKELAIQTEPADEEEEVTPVSAKMSYRRERRSKLGCGCRLEPDTLELKAACPYHRVVEKLRVNLREGRSSYSSRNTSLTSPRGYSSPRGTDTPLATSSPRDSGNRTGRIFCLTST